MHLTDAQENDNTVEDTRMTTTPAACQSIQDEINSVRQERAALQDELQHAAPAEKPDLLRRIRALGLQLGGLQMQLDDCLASQPPEPPQLPPIEAIFTGTTELTTTYESAPGPYFQDVTFKLVIYNNEVITLTFFPTIKVSFDTPLGTNTTTITRTGGGTGRYTAGKIVMPITLHFDQSIDIPLSRRTPTLASCCRPTRRDRP